MWEPFDSRVSLPALMQRATSRSDYSMLWTIANGASAHDAMTAAHYFSLKRREELPLHVGYDLIPVLKKALEGIDDDSVRWSLPDMANFYSRQGRFQRERPFSEFAYALNEQILRADHAKPAWIPRAGIEIVFNEHDTRRALMPDSLGVQMLPAVDLIKRADHLLAQYGAALPDGERLYLKGRLTLEAASTVYDLSAKKNPMSIAAFEPTKRLIAAGANQIRNCGQDTLDFWLDVGQMYADAARAIRDPAERIAIATEGAGFLRTFLRRETARGERLTRDLVEIARRAQYETTRRVPRFRRDYAPSASYSRQQPMKDPGLTTSLGDMLERVKFPDTAK